MSCEGKEKMTNICSKGRAQLSERKREEKRRNEQKCEKENIKTSERTEMGLRGREEDKEGREREKGRR